MLCSCKLPGPGHWSGDFEMLGAASLRGLQGCSFLRSRNGIASWAGSIGGREVNPPTLPKPGRIGHPEKPTSKPEWASWSSKNKPRAPDNRNDTKGLANRLFQGKASQTPRQAQTS